MGDKLPGNKFLGDKCPGNKWQGDIRDVYSTKAASQGGGAYFGKKIGPKYMKKPQILAFLSFFRH